VPSSGPACPAPRPVPELLHLAPGHEVDTAQTPPDHWKDLRQRYCAGGWWPASEERRLFNRRKYAPRATATGDQSSPYPGLARHEDPQATQRDLWSARALRGARRVRETARGNGSVERQHRAPGRFHHDRVGAPASPAPRTSRPRSSARYGDCRRCPLSSGHSSPTPICATSPHDRVH
jgi:hypothetical protein